ncbi:MAG TPA: hypothetical protein VFA13_00505 [Candidatus Acidoferrum sp.]|jgi:hypothetical protein|nr:hypothetical protein [Candidatus Acidoferrum sp.]
MKALCTGLSAVICAQLVLPPADAQNPPAGLNIVVIAGEGAINNIGQRATHDPVVRVEDENQRPVAGAAVVFTVPTEGASGEFANGSKNLVVTTDQQGRAAAQGLKANQITGRLQIHVTASYRGRTARTNITQFNMAVPGKRSGGGSAKKVAIILAIAGAAAGGGVAAAALGGKNSSSGSSPTPAAPAISITPGTGTVGPPH